MTTDLPEDLTAAEYRRRARVLVQQAADETHGPRADRLVGMAEVFALCALSAAHETPETTTHPRTEH